MLDEELLEEACRLAGVKTYSRAVNMALGDFVRRAKARRILELTGSGLWQDDLRQMRAERVFPAQEQSTEPGSDPR